MQRCIPSFFGMGASQGRKIIKIYLLFSHKNWFEFISRESQWGLHMNRELKRGGFWATHINLTEWTFWILRQWFRPFFSGKASLLEWKHVALQTWQSQGILKETRLHFCLTCTAQKRLCLSSLILWQRRATMMFCSSITTCTVSGYGWFTRPIHREYLQVLHCRAALVLSGQIETREQFDRLQKAFTVKFPGDVRWFC